MNPQNSKATEKGSTARFLRDVRAVARAWGLDVLNQRNRRQKQLEPVRAAMARADFPPKQKRGWPAPETIAWAARNISISKDNRSLMLTKEPRDLPVQANPAADGDLFSNLTPEQQLNRRLDLLQEKYFFPEKHPLSPIQKWQVEELRQHRPYLWHKDDGGQDDVNGANGTAFPRQCSGAPALCRYYQLRFKDYNIKVRPQYINNWQKGEHLPKNAPPHPAYDSAGRYTLADCFEWFTKWQLPKYKRARTPDLPGVAETEGVPLEDLRDQDEREEIEYRKWERARDRGEYIHKTVALATGVAAVKKIHVLMKSEDERILPKQRRDKLVSLGVAPEIASKFEIWDIDLARQITDRREKAMEALGSASVMEESLKSKG